MNALYGVIESLGRIGTLPWGLLVVALYLTFTRLKTGRRRNVAVILILGVFAAVPGRWAWERQQRVERYRAAEALFKERCRTTAGYRIHKVVEDVEGILLPKLRHTTNSGDRMVPGAAFVSEAHDDGYISTFLAYRYFSTDERNKRNFYSVTRPRDGREIVPGFRYVDVIDEKDGKRYRVTGSMKVTGRMDTNAVNVRRELEHNPDMDLNVYNWGLDREPAPEPAARYAVTFEDAVIPEERAVGLASSTVKVLDTQTNEVLGEMVRYVFYPGEFGIAPGANWGRAEECPGFVTSSHDATRLFVDRVLVARGSSLPPPLK